MLVFEQVKKVMAEVEMHVVGHTYITPWERTRDLERQTSGIFDFVRRGLGLIIRPVVKALVLSAVILGSGLLLEVLFPGASKPPLSAGVPFWLLLALALVAFRPPSHAALVGMTRAQVVATVKLIEKFANSPEALTALRNGVAIIQEVSKERLKRIQWMLGAVWAGIAWYATNTIFKTGVTTVPQDISILAACAILLFLAGCGLACYMASVRIVYQTLDFAFLQVEFTVLANKQTSNSAQSTSQILEHPPPLS